MSEPRAEKIDACESPCYHRHMTRAPFFIRLMGFPVAALVLAMLFAAPRAEANAGPPYYADGKIAAEPSGMEGIAISHETLVIDMRRLPASPPSMLGKTASPKTSNPIDVSATYSITNGGPAREIALVFASGAPSTAGFAVALNGQPIATLPAADVAVPAEWQPPATTPGLNGKDLIYLDPARDTFDSQQVEPWGHYPRMAERSATSSYAFTATIPAGDSVLAVRYQAEPQQYRSGGYTDFLKSYQFAYVLAPARAWDGFGGLDVTVHLPACWTAASRPELARVGDELRGSFDAVPADALALTVAPCDSVRAKPICGVAGFILPLGALGLVFARRRMSASAPLA